MAFIELENVEKVYPQPDEQVVALKSTSVSIDAGEFVVVTGESGAGKSTLLSLIGALDSPTAGRIVVSGCETTAMRASQLAQFRLRYVGYVFQDFCLVRHLTALDNVRLPLLFARRLNSDAQADAMLARFNLKRHRNRRPAELSRGEQQRVALARALVNQPQLLLADEPTANLDARNAAIVWDYFARLSGAGGITIIVVTHSRDPAPGVNRMITLDDGAILDDKRL